MLRGAIFFIGMALWGANRVPTLRYPPAAVLAGFLQVAAVSARIGDYKNILV